MKDKKLLRLIQVNLDYEKNVLCDVRENKKFTLQRDKYERVYQDQYQFHNGTTAYITVE